MINKDDNEDGYKPISISNVILYKLYKSSTPCKCNNEWKSRSIRDFIFPIASTAFHWEQPECKDITQIKTQWVATMRANMLFDSHPKLFKQSFNENILYCESSILRWNHPYGWQTVNVRFGLSTPLKRPVPGGIVPVTDIRTARKGRKNQNEGRFLVSLSGLVMRFILLTMKTDFYGFQDSFVFCYVV